MQHSIVYLDTLPSGQLLTVSDRGVVSTFNGRTHRSVAGPIGCTVNAAHRYQSGHLLATECGLHYYYKGRISAVGQLPIDAQDWTRMGGELFVLTKRDLYTLRGDRLQPLPRTAGEVDLVGAFAFTEVGGQSVILSNQGWIPTTKRDSLLRVPSLGDMLVYNALPTLATDDGLFVLDGSQQRQMTLGGKVFNEEVYQLADTGDGALLIVAESGTYLWDQATYSLNRLTDYPVQTLYTAQDVWGETWVALDNKLVALQSPSQSTSPRVQVQAMEAAGSAIDLSKPIRLRKAEATIAIEYTAVHLSGLDQQIDYTIDGGKEWVYAPHAVITTPQLPPGQYEVQVRSTIDDVHFGYSQKIKIIVASPRFPGWMIAATVLAALALLAALVLLRRARQTARLANLNRDKVLAENKAIQEEQRALQLQMNPHFLFNALTSIQGLISTGDHKRASSMLGTYAQLMRKVLTTSRTDWYALEEEVDFLEQYLSLEALSRGQSFDYEVTCSSDLLGEGLTVLPMVLQPFVENAIIHGVRKTTRRGKILIEIEESAEGAFLQVRIQDNGPGLGSSTPPDKHKSVALSVVRDRLARHGGSYDLQSDDSGTTVTVLLPVR